MALLPFQIQGGTLIVASTAASATAAQQVATGSIQGAFLQNLSTVDAYVSIGASTATAAAPTTASSTGSFPLMQRTGRSLTVPPNFFISAITTGGQANISVTPGFGQ